MIEGRLERTTRSDIILVSGEDAERVLGPGGAAKCLHLLAPRFFPLWDRAIAEAYGCALKARGQNLNNYRRFLETTRDQVLQLRQESGQNGNILKLLDEYNYCRYTKRWV